MPKILAENPVIYYYKMFKKRYSKNPTLREFSQFIKEYAIPKEEEQELLDDIEKNNKGRTTKVSK